MTRLLLLLVLALPMAAQFSSNARRLANIPLCSDAPDDDDVVTYEAASGCYKPKPPSGGPGGGATEAADLTDFKMTRTNSTTLTVAAGTYQYPNGSKVSLSAATIVVTGGAGTAYVFPSTDGTMKVGRTDTLTINCTGCTDYGAVAAYPDNVARIGRWAATAGAWDASGTDDRVALLGPLQLLPGAGIDIITTGTGAQQIAFSGSTYSCVKYTVPYAAISTAATTNSATLKTLAANEAIASLRLKHSTAFTGTSITAVTVSVGKSGSATAYSPAFDVLQATGSTVQLFDSGLYSADSASHAVTANFTSVGANLSALSAGSVDIHLCTVQLP